MRLQVTDHVATFEAVAAGRAHALKDAHFENGPAFDRVLGPAAPQFSMSRLVQYETR